MNLKSFFSTANRTGRFVRLLSTSYLGVGAATLYSVGLVPLILHYGNLAELGLWTLVTQFATYLGLVDAGVTSACIRRFVGPLSRREPNPLAETFKSAFLVSLAQGSLCCLLGLLSFPVGILLGISSEKLPLFSVILFSQFLIVGLFFLVRPFSALLLAAQRSEFNNLIGGFASLLSLGIIWVCLRMGLGLWSLPISFFFQQSASAITTLVMVHRLELLPAHWRKAPSSWQGVTMLFWESLDFFSWSGFSTAGATLQSVFLSRFLGLEAVAIWNVGFKVASFAYMIFTNLFNSAYAGLSEILERGDPIKCYHSFLRLFLLSISLLAFFSSAALWLNQPFVSFWTHHRIIFPLSSTRAVFAWLILAGIVRALACFANIWQRRSVMRWGPIVEFSSLSLSLGICYLYPSLYGFSLAVLASQLPPILLNYAPSLLAIQRQIGAALSLNQWSLFLSSGMGFALALAISLDPAPAVWMIFVGAIFLSSWAYFLIQETRLVARGD